MRLCCLMVLFLERVRGVVKRMLSLAFVFLMGPGPKAKPLSLTVLTVPMATVPMATVPMTTKPRIMGSSKS
ncbi:hypothetical protein BDW74DRAFT_155785 [Aspergillus multicolor]|uniref:uncharacterized protein n=1 Tax=Aspergillus multicolor TaxID=41759 RepID=UPI003CCDA752